MLWVKKTGRTKSPVSIISAIVLFICLSACSPSFALLSLKNGIISSGHKREKWSIWKEMSLLRYRLPEMSVRNMASP